MKTIGISICIVLISEIWKIIWCYTRGRTDLLFMEKHPACVRRLIICLVFTLMLNLITGVKTNRMTLSILYLMEIIACIDIQILKIPTELSVILAALCIYSRVQSGISVSLVLANLLTGSLWYIVRKKAGIAVSDILLIVLAALPANHLKEILLLSDFVLIGWGAAGLLLRGIMREKAPVRIPLAPVITVCFAVILF